MIDTDPEFLLEGPSACLPRMHPPGMDQRLKAISPFASLSAALVRWAAAS